MDRIAERERADFDPAAMPAITGLDGLIKGLCATAELQTGQFATRTRARYAFFLELAGDPELGDPLRRQRREFERWTERMVIAVWHRRPRTDHPGPHGARRRTAPAPAHSRPHS